MFETAPSAHQGSDDPSGGSDISEYFTEEYTIDGDCPESDRILRENIFQIIYFGKERIMQIIRDGGGQCQCARAIFLKYKAKKLTLTYSRFCAIMDRQMRIRSRT